MGEAFANRLANGWLSHQLSDPIRCRHTIHLAANNPSGCHPLGPVNRLTFAALPSAANRYAFRASGLVKALPRHITVEIWAYTPPRSCLPKRIIPCGTIALSRAKIRRTAGAEFSPRELVIDFLYIFKDSPFHDYQLDNPGRVSRFDLTRQLIKTYHHGR